MVLEWRDTPGDEYLKLDLRTWNLFRSTCYSIEGIGYPWEYPPRPGNYDLHDGSVEGFEGEVDKFCRRVKPYKVRQLILKVQFDPPHAGEFLEEEDILFLSAPWGPASVSWTREAAKKAKRFLDSDLKLKFF